MHQSSAHSVLYGTQFSSLQQVVGSLLTSCGTGCGSIPATSLVSSVISLLPVSSSPESSMSLKLTLISINNKMENNRMEVQITTSPQICVIQLPSTAVAKLWIEQNESQSTLLIYQDVQFGTYLAHAINDS